MVILATLPTCSINFFDVSDITNIRSSVPTFKSLPRELHFQNLLRQDRLAQVGIEASKLLSELDAGF